MKYRNKSNFRMLLFVEEKIKEIRPNEVFNSSEVLNYSFLEEVKELKSKVIRKPKTKSKGKVNGGDNPKN